MSTHLREKQEQIQLIISQLCEESERGTPIVVEGKKDANALRDLGVPGLILTIKTGGKSFQKALQEIEETKASKVVLLLDFDRRGRQETSKFMESLEHTGLKADLTFRRSLSAYAGRELQCIESLTRYLRTLEKKIQ